jgi:hypothetical protein
MNMVDKIARPGWRIMICLVLLVGTVGEEQEVFSDDTKFARRTLTGLPGVLVSVESLPDNVRGLLAVDALQTEVELRLRLLGIRVLTKEEQLSVAGSPTLYLNVNVSSRSEVPGLFAFDAFLALYQDVVLGRDPRIKEQAITWYTTGMGLVGRPNLEEGVRRAVRDELDEFINAYLSMNPKKPKGKRVRHDKRRATRCSAAWAL